MKTVETHKFKKGTKTTLDAIYMIQGLGNGDWWEHVDEDDCSEEIIITKTIEIYVRVTKPKETP